MKTVAEYTIREVEEDGKVRIQYISGGKVLLEGREYPQDKFGNPVFCDLVRDTLIRIKEGVV